MWKILRTQIRNLLSCCVCFVWGRALSFCNNKPELGKTRRSGLTACFKWLWCKLQYASLLKVVPLNMQCSYIGSYYPRTPWTSEFYRTSLISGRKNAATPWRPALSLIVSSVPSIRFQWLQYVGSHVLQLQNVVKWVSKTSCRDSFKLGEGGGEHGRKKDGGGGVVMKAILVLQYFVNDVMELIHLQFSGHLLDRYPPILLYH